MNTLIQAFATIALLVGALTRIKYVWQGNKIRRRESSADVSRKFLILTIFASIIMIIYNALVLSIVNLVFWVIEIVVVAYAFACCYKYYPNKQPGLWAFTLDSFKTGWRDTIFKADKGTIVYTYVVCDLFHYGHLRLLKQAKSLGDWLIVGVLTDKATSAYKRKPIIPFEERMEIVKQIKYVDRVVPQYTLDPTENLKQLGKVDILVHAHDWFGDFPGSAYMRSIGKEAIRANYYHYQSTTKIIEKIYEQAERR